MLNKKPYKNILIYLLFYNQKSSKTIYFNLRNYYFLFFMWNLKIRKKLLKNKEKKRGEKGGIFKNKKDIKNIKRQNKGNIAWRKKTTKYKRVIRISWKW